MFVVHLGIGWTLADGTNALQPVAAGRSAALFALLAGVSAALLSGGRTPATGPAMGVALWRVVIRGLLMLPLGTALTLLGTPVAVILAYYAVFFLLTAPFLHERWTIVAGAAAALAVVGPIVSFHVRAAAADGPLRAPFTAVNTYDPLEALAGEGLIDLLLTGAYPALTWMPFVLAGLAIGRLDLRSTRVRWTLVGAGAATAALAHTASWVALGPLGGRARLEASFTPAAVADHGAPPDAATALADGFPGTVPVHDWVWLLSDAPHSGTPLEVFAAGGAAAAVLGGCLLVGEWLRWVLYPVAAVGALALTAYVAHVLLIWVAERPWGALLDPVLGPVVLVGSLAGAAVWRWTGRRGPLEQPLHAVSLWAARRIP
jgi:uncharacterized membrane protein YeiB